MNFDLEFTPYKQIISKWIIDLSVKHNIIKLLYNNIGENFGDLGLGEEILDMTPKICP